MNKNDLIDALAPRMGGRAAAALAVEALVDVVLRQVAGGGSVSITGFGTFEPVDRAPRTGRNPHTGEAVPIPATTTPRFRPGSYFRTVVADPTLLPSEGLAGARVGTADEEASGSGSRADASGRGAADGAPAPGAPATIRRPSGRVGGRPAGARTSGRQAEERARARRRTGTPATVRAEQPGPAAATPAAEPAREPGSAGRLSIGGEQITREMITAKKAQLARAKHDEDTPRHGAGAEGASAGRSKKGKGKKGKGKGKNGKGEKKGAKATGEKGTKAGGTKGRGKKGRTS
ncbi:HU family DNA-binding protein [Ornithinimicrobium pekingense]|uniref:DNA-binding protein HU-beta n=1 Tax=Ornithinimicrobium pekingense TaxID=384677 RepID=A0ABQ2F539_9MICO|nr:HU family DNA-binding protein [Ornithinimicrobium pekingense]GGK62831.1 DNA-binding protein HU-beta [Ornithinimicrobium pekingense]